MRRGRPTTSHQSQPKPNPSPSRGNNSDPFAALDSKTSSSRRSDELSSRFPSLDQFSLLHDKGAKFEFDAYSPTETKPKDLNQRVTEALADDAFISPPVKPAASSSMPSGSVMSRAQKIISSTPELQSAISAPPATTTIQAPTPFKPSMVSTGTMTSPSPPVIEVQPSQRKYNPSPIYRFPPADHHRSVSLGRTPSPEIKPTVQEIEIARPSTSRNSSSYLRPAEDSYSVSSRPSLESGRPSPHISNDAFEPPVRTKSTDPRPRPSSAYLESHMDYLREKELSQSSSHSISKPGFLKSHNSKTASPPFPSPEVSPTDNSPLDSNDVDFLRKIESSSSTTHRKDKERRSASSSSSSKHVKRASLPSMALNGTKNLFAGKFGDAFKRFENNANQGPRTPSPETVDHRNFDRRELLTPIAGSEATDGRSDDGRPDDEDAAINPEKRRELERRRLEEEERRVEEAAREYRKRLAERETGAPLPRSIAGVTRASTIQNKVKSLLEENERSDRDVRRTAEGYGRFTEPDRPPTQPSQMQQSAPQPPPSFSKPVVARKPVQGKPSAPPKPVHLHTGGAGAGLQHTSSLPVGHGGGGMGIGLSNSPPKPAHLQGGLVRPLTASQTRPGMSSQLQRPGLGLGISGGGDGGGVGHGSKGIDPYNMTLEEREDYVADFAKRFPSLSGIEMVETVVEGRRSGERRR
jgi:AP2-associated kinase